MIAKDGPAIREQQRCARPLLPRLRKTTTASWAGPHNPQQPQGSNHHAPTTHCRTLGAILGASLSLSAEAASTGLRRPILLDGNRSRFNNIPGDYLWRWKAWFCWF